MTKTAGDLQAGDRVMVKARGRSRSQRVLVRSIELVDGDVFIVGDLLYRAGSAYGADDFRGVFGGFVPANELLQDER